MNDVKAFDAEMRSVYDRAKTELGYNATYYLKMLAEQGAVETARRLVLAPQMSDGFAYLWEHHRLDLTVEAVALMPEFADLLGDEVVEAARRRLESCGYTF